MIVGGVGKDFFVCWTSGFADELGHFGSIFDRFGYIVFRELVAFDQWVDFPKINGVGNSQKCSYNNQKAQAQTPLRRGTDLIAAVGLVAVFKNNVVEVLQKKQSCM